MRNNKIRLKTRRGGSQSALTPHRYADRFSVQNQKNTEQPLWSAITPGLRAICDCDVVFALTLWGIIKYGSKTRRGGSQSALTPHWNANRLSVQNQKNTEQPFWSAITPGLRAICDCDVFCGSLIRAQSALTPHRYADRFFVQNQKNTEQPFWSAITPGLRAICDCDVFCGSFYHLKSLLSLTTNYTNSTNKNFPHIFF